MFSNYAWQFLTIPTRIVKPFAKQLLNFADCSQRFEHSTAENNWTQVVHDSLTDARSNDSAQTTKGAILRSAERKIQQAAAGRALNNPSLQKRKTVFL